MLYYEKIEKDQRKSSLCTRRPKKCNEIPDGTTKKLVLHFAEKVLLRKLLDQLGQLHFIIGLKFDFLADFSSNERRNYIYELVEGHWSHERVANVLVPMIHHLLQEQKRTSDQKKMRTVSGYTSIIVRDRINIDSCCCTVAGLY